MLPNAHFVKVFCDDYGGEYDYNQNGECDDPVFCGEDNVDPLPGIDPPVDEFGADYGEDYCDDIFDDCREECLSINEIDDTIFNR